MLGFRDSLKRVGFDENSRDHWVSLPDAVFDTIDGQLQFRHIQATTKPNINGKQHLTGSKLHGQQISDVIDREVLLDDFPNASDSGTSGPFPNQQGPALASQEN